MQLRYLLLSVVAGLVVGCLGSRGAQVSYDSDENLTRYEVGNYTVSTRSGSNFATSKSINMRAVGQCEGANCSPDVVQLIFTASGNQQLSLSGLDGKIVADEMKFDWSTADASQSSGIRANDQMIRASGKFAVVDVPVGTLKKIATASSVEGSIGGQSLDLGSSVQAGFQDLLRKMSPKSSNSETSGAP